MKIELIGNIVEINGERLLTVHREATEAGRMRLEDFIKEVDGVEAEEIIGRLQAEAEEIIGKLEAELDDLRSAYSRGYANGWNDRDENRTWDDEEPD